MVEDGKPRRIAIFAFDEHVLAESAFKGEAEAQRGISTGFVECIAFPFHAPIAEFLKAVAQEQVAGFGVGFGALCRGRIPDVPQLGHTVLGMDAHERDAAENVLRSNSTHGVCDHVWRGLPFMKECSVLLCIGQWAYRQVAPEFPRFVIRVGNSEELLNIRCYIERCQGDELTCVCMSLGVHAEIFICV